MLKLKYLLIIISLISITGLTFTTTDLRAGKTIEDNFTDSLVGTAQQTGHLDGDTPAFFGSDDPIEIIGLVIKVLLSFLGVIFLVLLIYGGYLWMMDRGEEALAKKAKDVIKNAIIGLIIVLAAYAITALFTQMMSDVSTDGSSEYDQFIP